MTGGRGPGRGDAVPLPRQVLTLDARNHGGSPHSPLMTYEAMSLDVQHLLTRLGITKCILLGHSMGGKTAMTLALQRVGRRGAGGGAGPGGGFWGCRKGGGTWGGHSPHRGWLFSMAAGALRLREQASAHQPALCPVPPVLIARELGDRPWPGDGHVELSAEAGGS